MPEELAFRERRLEKIREAMAALEAEAQAAAEQAEAEGGKHPGVPDDKASVTSPIPSRASSPHLEERTSCKRTTVRRWWTAHQVRATKQTSDKQQAAAMIEGSMAGSADVFCAGDASSRRSRPATAGLCHPRPEVAYPAICLPGTGCDGSYRPGGVGSATLCGCKLWSGYSARSSRAGDSGSSCCGDWRR